METPTQKVAPVALDRLVQRLREWKRDGYWIAQALRPHLEISIKTDWEPKARMPRFLQKANCEICGRRFRGIEEGTISKREKLCGDHCMMTVKEIADHYSLNADVEARRL